MIICKYFFLSLGGLPSDSSNFPDTYYLEEDLETTTRAPATLKIAQQGKTVSLCNYDFENENQKNIYGNTVEANSSGDMGLSGDETYQKFVYTNNTNLWIVNTLTNHSVYGFNSNTLMKQTLYHYDNAGLYGVPTKGDITRKIEWSNSSADTVSYYGYDSYGNVIQYNDSLNRTTNYTFGTKDTTFTFVDQVSNPKGQKTKYSYNLGFGTLLNVTDSNGIETNYTYDIFGRITKEIQPFDSAVYPTKEYIYTIDGTAPERIIVMQKEVSGAIPTLDTRYFYDGFGNLIQVKTEAENSSLQIAGDIYYDSLDRPIKTSNPYYVNFSGDYNTTNNSIVGSNYNYDPLDRVVQVLNPDGTRIQINFTLWNVSTLDERGKRKDYILDGNGNIIKVMEYNNGSIYTTNYRYDALNQLIQINDSKKNLFNFTYDSLGRTIRLQDPDLRTWNYTYDSLGNLISQEGAGGELITDGDYYREYNALHQLTRVRKKTSTGKIVEEYSYGPDGERVMTVNYLTNTTIYTPFREWMMIVNRTGSYNYTYVYDGNTLVAKINPDGSKYFYSDDHLGSTNLITDSNGNIVEETFYTPFGATTQGGVKEAYLLYTDQFKDAIGCYDYGARVYCPKWYHFTSADPITANVFDPQGLNRYAYVKNNPYVYVDPDGKQVGYWITNALSYFNTYIGAYKAGESGARELGITYSYEISHIPENYHKYVNEQTNNNLRQIKEETTVPDKYIIGAEDLKIITISPREDQGVEMQDATTIENVYTDYIQEQYGEESLSGTSSADSNSGAVKGASANRENMPQGYEGGALAAERNNPNKPVPESTQTSTLWKVKKPTNEGNSANLPNTYSSGTGGGSGGSCSGCGSISTSTSRNKKGGKR